ncbi:salt stress-induced protein isoform X1 [Sorghum bicolor]|nr:salt stress-induced protein isoform X1 [Sorghum bicolor]|eukprot:XP_021310247.1 salt stress-induced protein isoform X1 [Sorghum bicolor]
MKEVVPAPTKKGPWGGNGGSLWEMEGKSQRLENVTIYHIGAVEGIQFSYVDEDGQIRTTGTWGRVHPSPLYKTEIKFGPSEFVKQITGAARHGGWLSQFKIVTSHKTYGPFGVDAGAPSFSYTVREDELVVGFFANADTFVQSIGVCTI